MEQTAASQLSSILASQHMWEECSGGEDEKTRLEFVFSVDKTGCREYFLNNLNYGTSFTRFRRIPC